VKLLRNNNIIFFDADSNFSNLIPSIIYCFVASIIIASIKNAKILLIITAN